MHIRSGAEAKRQGRKLRKGAGWGIRPVLPRTGELMTTKRAPSYAELLRHPKWQKRRLQVLEREDYTCQWCDATEKTLHVHHRQYRKGAKPWDYDDDELWCLCEDCHDLAHYLKGVVGVLVGQMREATIRKVIGYANALVATNAAGSPNDPDIKLDLRVQVPTRNEAIGIGDFVGATPDEVEVAARERGDHVTIEDLRSFWFRGPHGQDA